MPVRAPRICGCGRRVASGVRCSCEARRKAEADKRRPSARQRGYDTDWQREAKAFLAAHPVCTRPGCDAPASVVDHIEPHRGNRAFFWNRANWQPLCRTCHASWKQSIERKAK